MKKSTELFGELWSKVCNKNSDSPDIELDFLLSETVTLAANSNTEDMPYIEKWARAYIDIVKSSGDEVDRYLLAHLWATNQLGGVLRYNLYYSGDYILKSEEQHSKEYNKILLAEKKALDEMMKVLKKLGVNKPRSQRLL